MAVFLPGYTWVTNARNGGGAYATSGPASILLHMTVSMGVSAGYISGHPYPPHLWANPYNGDRFQTVTLDRSAFALYQPDYGNSWTNRKGYTLQTEVVGVPEVSVATYTDAQCRWIGEQVVAPQARWLASIGHPVNLNHVRYHSDTSSSASDSWPGRMSEGEWDAFDGLLAHIDVPYNDHWDCSAERLDHIAQYAIAALGGTTGEDDMFSDQDRALLTNVDGLLKALTPTIQQDFNNGVSTDGLLKAVTPIVQQTFNHTAWTWERLQETDKVGRSTFNNTVEILAGMGSTGPAPTVQEVLAKATDRELYTEIARRAAQPRPTGADVEEQQAPPSPPPPSPPAAAA